MALVAAILMFLEDETALDQVLSLTAAKLFAPVAAWIHKLRDSDVSDQLVIVDVDAGSVREAEEGWPFLYGRHARILEQIRRQEPKAVFVDFQFESNRIDPSLPRLLATLCRFKGDGIPVFVAIGALNQGGRLRQELEDLRSDDGHHCIEKVTVDYDVMADQTVWTYPIVSRLGDREVRSAGLALAEAMRGKPIQRDGQETLGLTWLAGDGANGPLWLAQGSDATSTGDGSEVPLAGADAPALAGQGPPAKRYCREPGYKELTLIPQIFRMHDARPFCPPYQSVVAARMTWPGTERDRTVLKELLRGKAVLYGGSFDPNDLVTSPLHGRIPGVYLHAQAANNLMEDGDQFRRPTLAREANNPYLDYGIKFVAAYLISLSMGFASSAGHAIFLALRRKYSPQFDFGRKIVARLLIWVSSAWSDVRAFFMALRTNVSECFQRTCCCDKQQSEVELDTEPPCWRRHLSFVCLQLLEFVQNLIFWWLGLIFGGLLFWVASQFINTSLIGYSSLLVFMLFGEALRANLEVNKLAAPRKQ